eukprot:g1318.t1
MVGTGAAKELRMLDAEMYDYKTTKTPATSTNSKPSYSRGARHASASAQPRRPQGKEDEVERTTEEGTRTHIPWYDRDDEDPDQMTYDAGDSPSYYFAPQQPPAPGATASVGSNRSANASKRSTTFAGSTSFVEQPSALTSKEASGSGTTEDALSGGDITGDCEQPLQPPATLAASASRSNSRSGRSSPRSCGGYHVVNVIRGESALDRPHAEDGTRCGQCDVENSGGGRPSRTKDFRKRSKGKRTCRRAEAFPPTSTAASPPAGGASPSVHTARHQSWANNNSISTSFGDTKQIIIEALQNFEESDGELLKMKSQQHLSEILEKAIAVVEAQRPKGANCADLIEVLARRCAKFGHDAGLCRKTMRIFVHCIYHVGSELLRATVFEAVIGMVERSDAESGDPLIEHQAMLVFANGLKAGKIRIGLFSRAVRLAVQRVGACREVCYFLIEAATRYGQDYGQICLRLGCLRLLDTVPESYAKEREHARTAISQAVAKLSSTDQACGVNFDHYLPEVDEELNLNEGSSV